MKPKDLLEIEKMFDDAVKCMNDPKKKPNEFYAAMTVAFTRIPILIKAIRDKDKEIEKLEDIESDLNNTTGFMQSFIDDLNIDIKKLRDAK